MQPISECDSTCKYLCRDGLKPIIMEGLVRKVWIEYTDKLSWDLMLLAGHETKAYLCVCRDQHLLPVVEEEYGRRRDEEGGMGHRTPASS